MNHGLIACLEPQTVIAQHELPPGEFPVLEVLLGAARAAHPQFSHTVLPEIQPILVANLEANIRAFTTTTSQRTSAFCPSLTHLDPRLTQGLTLNCQPCGGFVGLLTADWAHFRRAIVRGDDRLREAERSESGIEALDRIATYGFSCGGDDSQGSE